LVAAPQGSNFRGPTLNIRPDLTNLLYDPATAQIEPEATTEDGVEPENEGTFRAPYTSSRIVPLTADTTYPFRAVGKFFFTQPGVGNFVCSAGVISRRVIATAGHCVHSGGSGGIWASSVTVYPGRNGANVPWGSCGAAWLASVQGWTVDANERFDYGVVKLNCDVGNTVGWFGFFWTSSGLENTPTTINGYPGDKPLTQWLSVDKVRVSDAKQVFYKNDSQPGNSGGGVWQDGPPDSVCTGACIMAIHAYGTHGAAPHSDHNHGTRIDETRFNNLVNWKNAAK
jgi:glutamyl endopeptidase